MIDGHFRVRTNLLLKHLHYLLNHKRLQVRIELVSTRLAYIQYIYLEISIVLAAFQQCFEKLFDFTYLTYWSLCMLLNTQYTVLYCIYTCTSKRHLQSANLVENLKNEEKSSPPLHDGTLQIFVSSLQLKLSPLTQFVFVQMQLYTTTGMRLLYAIEWWF